MGLLQKESRCTDGAATKKSMFTYGATAILTIGHIGFPVMYTDGAAAKESIITDGAAAKGKQVHRWR